MKKPLILFGALLALSGAATGLIDNDDDAWFEIIDPTTGDTLSIGDVVSIGDKENGACHANTPTTIRITSNATASFVSAKLSTNDDCEVVLDDVVSVRGDLDEVRQARERLPGETIHIPQSEDPESCEEDEECVEEYKAVTAETYVEYRTRACMAWYWAQSCSEYPPENSGTETTSTLIWSVDCYGTQGCMNATHETHDEDCRVSNTRYWVNERCGVWGHGDYTHDDCCDHAWVVHAGSYVWSYSDHDYNHWRWVEPVGHGNGYHMECSYYSSGWSGHEEYQNCLEYPSPECEEDEDGEMTCDLGECDCDDVERPAWS